MNRHERRIWGARLLVMIVAAALVASPEAFAFSGGITTTNLGVNGCNLCHSGGTAPSVSLTGPSIVGHGDTNVYTLVIDNPPGQNAGGLNVSALAGVFATGGTDAANTQTLTGTGGRLEITHSGAKAAVADQTIFSFLWTAPNADTSVTLNAWGNAVNGNGLSSGDRAAMTSLVVIVGATPTPTHTPTITPTPTTTPTATPQMYDAVVLPPKPVKMKLATGVTALTKNVKVGVQNGSSTGAVSIKLQASGCGGVAGTPDFDRDMGGAQDTVLLAAGKAKKAVVPLTITNAAFAAFNEKSAARCAVTFTATAEVPGNVDPAPSNDVARMELTVFDENDGDAVAAPNHESATTSLKPIKLKIAEGATAVTKMVKLKVTNADAGEDPGHPITVSLGAGTCVGVGLPDFDPDMGGVQSSVTVEGNKTPSGVVTVSLSRDDFTSSNKKSPARCTQQLCAAGPMGNAEPNPSNDCTELLIDVLDENDF